MNKFLKVYLLVFALTLTASMLCKGLLRMAHIGEQHIAAVRQETAEARDAWWRAEVARSDAAALRRQAETAKRALAAEQAAAEQKAALEAELAELERKNENLQNNGCGIDADHVRLLNAAARAAAGD